MAGLVAAVRLRELGHEVVVHEKGTRAGGSMLLSSGVPWRHRDWEAFRQECPDGDERLQRLIWERLDSALDWLQALGAPVVEATTGNPLTVGRRFDPQGLTRTLAARAGELVLESDGCAVDADATILCTGGFAASAELVARWIAPAGQLRLRTAPWSTGDGLAAALARGAATSGRLAEFYGRNMPDAPWGEDELVALSQLYAAHARIVDAQGEEFFRAEDVSWSETNVVQATARRPGAKAYYLLDADALAKSTRYGTVGDAVAAAPADARLAPEQLPFAVPPGTLVAVRVVASITYTLGGIAVDERARVLGEDGRPIEGIYAAGVDVGGVASGGYASGLAQAIVLGLAAADGLAG